MGSLADWVHIVYRGLEFEPSCGVIQRIPDGGKGTPGRLIGIVHRILDKVGISGALAALAKALDFFQIVGKVIGGATEAGCIWAGAERHM